ncbi:MAG: butyryl-CoA:acetate CoA-transferase [Armatimonadetes bacterium]|nr:butyryl-CoA:acetate CoA-transferase [Armatimonadota bacterium]
MRTYLEEYKKKLISADEAVKLVKSGDCIEFGYCLNKPIALDIALAKRKEELYDVTVHCSNSLTTLHFAEADPEGRHFIYNTGHCSRNERPYMGKNGCYVPSSFGQNPEWIRKGYRRVDVVMIQVSPMDKHGFFNFGPSATFLKACCEVAKIVVVEVNSLLPRALGGREEAVHISEVDYIVEAPEANVEYLEIPSPPITDVDLKIAQFIVEEIEDGSCLQLGIGGMPNAVGKLIAQSDLKDLGIHTELLCDAMLEMYLAGKVTGLRKSIDRGKIVYTFALGSRELYNFIDDNPALAIYPVDYTNDLRIISQNDRAVSINSGLEVDLTGQVCSESIGTKHISGSGGQLEFHWGAYLSKGGKSFICMPSTYQAKNGEVVSRIKPIITPGGVVTTPRPTVHYLVTEYGKANLKAKSTWERAEAIISLAHPDFREELISAAEKSGIWRRTNRIP